MFNALLAGMEDDSYTTNTVRSVEISTFYAGHITTLIYLVRIPSSIWMSLFGLNLQPLSMSYRKTHKLKVFPPRTFKELPIILECLAKMCGVGPIIFELTFYSQKKGCRAS